MTISSRLKQSVQAQSTGRLTKARVKPRSQSRLLSQPAKGRRQLSRGDHERKE